MVDASVATTCGVHGKRMNARTPMPWTAGTSSNRSGQRARRLIPAVPVVRLDPCRKLAARHARLNLAPVLVVLTAFLLALSASPALAASIRPHGYAMPSQLQADPAAGEAPGDGTTAAGDEETAALTETRRAILYRQGAQTVASLARVAPVAVVNPLPVPVPQPAVQPAPAAAPDNAVADHVVPGTAASVQQVKQVIGPRVPVAAGVARSVQAVVGVIARGAAATDMPDTAAAASAATAVPRVNLAVPFSRLSMLTLLVMLCGILLIRIWQIRREPFVLKVRPIKV